MARQFPVTPSIGHNPWIIHGGSGAGSASRDECQRSMISDWERGHIVGRISKDARELIETKVQPEEIIYLVQEMAKLHDEGRDPDWESSVLILVKRYPGEPGKTHCISERMRCLLEMTKDVRMRGWTMEGPEEGCLLTSEAVFRAAALCPLHGGSRRVWFDADEFFSIALGEMPSEGRA